MTDVEIGAKNKMELDVAFAEASEKSLPGMEITTEKQLSLPGTRRSFEALLYTSIDWFIHLLEADFAS